MDVGLFCNTGSKLTCTQTAKGTARENWSGFECEGGSEENKSLAPASRLSVEIYMEIRNQAAGIRKHVESCRYGSLLMYCCRYSSVRDFSHSSVAFRLISSIVCAACTACSDKTSSEAR